MERYSVINKKYPREIVLLKSTPCKWGKCTFCDYILDNTLDIGEINRTNQEILKNITGQYGTLEVINSGNVFELPPVTLQAIKEIVHRLSIRQLFLEAHWIYRKKLEAMRQFFGVDIMFKTGLETFDTGFRENILHKGFHYSHIDELKSYFQSVCLMVGIHGQTRAMINNDIQLALKHFKHFTVNVYTENSTSIKPDYPLIKWFQENYRWLDKEPQCEVLWLNTDFGVG